MDKLLRLVRAGLLIAWLQLNVSRFHSVRARLRS